ncbi:UNVERIFIED_CONTAM: hypothetical protein K2H54_038910 [Gekko kuhli]
MEADPVLAVLLAIMAAEAHLQQFKEAAQWSTFNWLVDALRDVLHRRRTEMHAPVSVERRVAVAVWWMANNMSYRAVAHQFGLARSTVAGIVVEVTGHHRAATGEDGIPPRPGQGHVLVGYHVRGPVPVSTAQRKARHNA